MKKLSIILTGILFFMLSCEKDPTEPKEIKLKAGSEAVIESMNEFGMDLFEAIMLAEDENKNVFISPTSISLALAMTLNGANNTTEDSMAFALRMDHLEADDINQTFKDLIAALETCDEKVLLEIANSIWYRQGFQVEQDFLDINAEYYAAEVSELDFESDDALSTINDWVSDNTNKKIPKIINEISPYTVMFLINAIYFKGDWAIEFKKSDTYEGDFHLADGSTKKVDMMTFTEEIGYFDMGFMQICELDYGRGNYSMMIMLPGEDFDLDSLQSLPAFESMNFSSSSSFSLPKSEVNLSLPKFKFEYEIMLNDILSDMGMENAFIPEEADFSGINPDRDLYISYVKHKTFVDVNEEGTEAAAATVVAINDLAAGPGNTMIVDRPFIFTIREKTTNTVVFMGRVSNPGYGE